MRESAGRYLGLRLAGLPARALAILIDGFIVIFVVYGGFWVTGVLDDYFAMISRSQGGLASVFPVALAVTSPSYLAYLLPTIGFPTVLEACLLQWRSQSVGKMLLHLKVVGPTGRRLTPAQAWLRATARTAFVLLGTATWVLDHLAVFVGRGRATLHDRIASTRVVRE